MKSELFIETTGKARCERPCLQVRSLRSQVICLSTGASVEPYVETEFDWD